MKKTTVAVLFGGVSTEHEVSRLSVTSVLNNLDREAYEVLPVGITKDGRWFLYQGEVSLIANGRWEQETNLLPALLSPDRSHHGLLVLESAGWRVCPVDVVFPVLHGKNGEDGTIQGLLELAGIPCVGCGVLSSANCMDKDVAKMIFCAHHIPTAKWIPVRRERRADAALTAQVEKELGWPVFVKPANAGSSVGVSKAKNAGELCAALDEAFHHDNKVIVEEAIVGAEVECAVMGNREDCFASTSVGEIVPTRELYDYEGKYLDGSTDLYLPARIPPEQAQLLRRTALRAYRALECAGLARVDFFAPKDGTVVLNEINTMPGFTNISMYPKLMMASGMTYPQMLTRLIQLAMKEEN